MLTAVHKAANKGWSISGCHYSRTTGHCQLPHVSRQVNVMMCWLSEVWYFRTAASLVRGESGFPFARVADALAACLSYLRSLIACVSDRLPPFPSSFSPRPCILVASLSRYQDKTIRLEQKAYNYPQTSAGASISGCDHDRTSQWKSHPRPSVCADRLPGCKWLAIS